ncbi:hypothetical protein [Micromonospora sp. IBSANI012]|uniref:hypothetical protein n=1 Tax=Micromonospora sp. IBSANI012 TaxID=3457761 RepID=UPI004059E7D4
MSEQPAADVPRPRRCRPPRGRALVGFLRRRGADRSYRALRPALVVVCLIAVAGLPAGSSVAGVTGSTALRVLQLNLCNSGRAGCYTGRSVTEAAEVIGAELPDLVTLNEICQDDVAALERVFAAVHGGGTVVSAFKAAGDRPTGAVTECRNGQPYGVGLLTHLAAPYPEHTVHSGIHPTQDVTDPEERPWLCVHVAGVLHACTTHLAATSAHRRARPVRPPARHGRTDDPQEHRIRAHRAERRPQPPARRRPPTCGPACRRATCGSTTARCNRSW